MISRIKRTYFFFPFVFISIGFIACSKEEMNNEAVSSEPFDYDVFEELVTGENPEDVGIEISIYTKPVISDDGKIFVTVGSDLNEVKRMAVLANSTTGLECIIKEDDRDLYHYPHLFSEPGTMMYTKGEFVVGQHYLIFNNRMKCGETWRKFYLNDLTDYYLEGEVQSGISDIKYLNGNYYVFGVVKDYEDDKLYHTWVLGYNPVGELVKKTIVKNMYPDLVIQTDNGFNLFGYGNTFNKMVSLDADLVLNDENMSTDRPQFMTFVKSGEYLFCIDYMQKSISKHDLRGDKILIRNLSNVQNLGYTNVLYSASLNGGVVGMIMDQEQKNLYFFELSPEGEILNEKTLQNVAPYQILGYSDFKQIDNGDLVAVLSVSTGIYNEATTDKLVGIIKTKF